MTVEPGPSRIVTGTEIPECNGTPVLTAHGDPDDHLRLTVLLARALVGAASGGHLREAAHTCMTPTSISWAQRLDALSYVLEHAPPPEGHRYGAVLVDPDALDVGYLQADDLWDDRDFRRQRGELLQVVLDAMADGGWLVVRPNPSSAAMRRLDGVAKLGFVETESAVPAPEETALGGLQKELAPECRPILSWIVRSGKLPEREVRRRFDSGGAEGFQQDILGVAYEVIPAHARKAAKRLAALRGEQLSNGMLGPFHLLDDTDPGEAELAINSVRRLDAPTVPLAHRAVRILEQCGFLQPGPTRDGHRTLRMPRAVREHVLPLAMLGDSDILEHQHRAWGAGPLDHLEVDQQLEAHFHAVQGGNWEDALRTARYYATDLRALAFRFSREERYPEAADVYRKIVQEFDPEDAYAWEYLGFNLALASGRGPLPEERAVEIRNAYAKAFEHDPQNPLYHGRLLGFRAQLGEDVHTEVQRGLKRYLIRYGDQSRAINYFTEPVRQAMDVNMFGSLQFSFRLESVLRLAPQLSLEYRPLRYLPLRYG
jgi:hypothetical protein